ncbi:MAG TPA: murein transglycosylase A [Methylophilaceae bacterium]|nr:murein transglycosylase A [Methylophilaceae bacterium]
MPALRIAFLIPLLLLVASCSQQPVKVASQTGEPACECKAGRKPVQLPDMPLPPSVTEPIEETPTATPDYGLLQPSSWEAVDAQLMQDDLAASWQAWQQSCNALQNRAPWQAACQAAARINASPVKPDNETIASYLKQYFDVYQATTEDGSDTGLITGYYEPLLHGSRFKTNVYRYPLYGRPGDLITVDLSSLYPELKHKRVRGRLIGNKVVPYYDRREIEENDPLQGQEILWVDDIIDLFFLQIQGSGVVQLENGERVHVGYADQNGQAYSSIGRLLIEQGELTADKASMQGIKNWARNNTDKLRDLLYSNPSYVFFRELPAGLPGPLGALGVPIIGERSVAVDPRYIPLGAPILLSTTYPNSSKPLNRLMMAQDTGGAIKGGVRADFFWGAGAEAGKKAGAMKQQGKIWVLLPKDFFLMQTVKK